MVTVPKHHSQQSEGEVAQRHASALLAKNPAELEAAYDGWATKYDDDVAAISGLGLNQWGQSAVKTLQQHCSPTNFPRLLDFGCGTGPIGPLLHELGWRTVLHGCDLSHGMLQIAQSRGCYTKLIKSTFGSSGAEPGYYHVIHSVGIFAPGQAPPQIFDEFIRLLQTGGLAIFTVRTGYYDGPEGAAHKEYLEDLCRRRKWDLISQTEEDYLPKENVMCYVFCMKIL
jgi:predicted TPR repeat methyltransferase